MAVARIVERPVTARRAEICRTAARIFRDRGFDATSVSDIARALRMTKAGLYHYFDSKEELLFEIMTFGLERVHEEVVIPARRIRDPEARLRQIVMDHARITTRAQGAVAQLFDETPALSPAARRTIRASERRYFQLVRSTLVELHAVGRLRNVDLTVAAFSIIGMILWLPRWFRQGGRLSNEQAAREIANLALEGVLRPGTNGRRTRSGVKRMRRRPRLPPRSLRGP
jgi:AcrR family transcriptional regulator